MQVETGLLIILSIIFSFNISQASSDGNDHKDGSEGVISYDGEETLSLNGEWRLFWNQLYSEDSDLLTNGTVH
ncbi:hypothetical protein BFP72_07450 [Reichenbachiella sp. 5M10]|uniref:hypothetical protein n=1 Tax=Reichenbachiella sp. 5M10 TaxID=1889772 RepID=UPI000C158497|nr:hypothetical protein [Reichenbachiella sp. 5M10]PIB35242.1 hypothetical protein BFP72_07450 [Reichenbachiella sp. 5M10]